MGESRWHESIDGVVRRARFGPGANDDFWESAHIVVDGGLPDDELRYLATVGLAELASQEHIVDRDRHEPCMGRRLMMERFFPDQSLEDEPG